MVVIDIILSPFAVDSGIWLKLKPGPAASASAQLNNMTRGASAHLMFKFGLEISFVWSEGLGLLSSTVVSSWLCQYRPKFNL